MTTQQLCRLELGTQVFWREGSKSPRAGKITEAGTVCERLPGEVGHKRYIRWQDGQETDGSDTWALKNVEVGA